VQRICHAFIVLRTILYPLPNIGLTRSACNLKHPAVRVLAREISSRLASNLASFCTNRLGVSIGIYNDFRRRVSRGFWDFRAGVEPYFAAVFEPEAG
jgi:hypothetical protein